MPDPSQWRKRLILFRYRAWQDGSREWWFSHWLVVPALIIVAVVILIVAA